jgi:type I restriction enzyme R subunit
LRAAPEKDVSRIRISERSAAQSPLIAYTTEIGWRPLSRNGALTERGGEGGTLLYKTLERKLLDLNPGVLTNENVREVIERIESARAGIEGNYEILRWLRGEQTVKVASEKRTRNVILLGDQLEDNVFHVTGEWEYSNGLHTNRADVMFVINGIPVAIVETKHAGKSDAIDRGLKQIREYHDETPEMLTAPQVFDLTRVVEFYYGVTWSLDRKAVFNWKDEEAGNFEKKVKRFFGRDRFLRMLRDWILFYRKDDELRKIVLRQHQTRAVDKAIARSLDPEKSRGLVWHTQGSGKTFTMISTAEQLLEHPALRNQKPTVLMIVDRTELEQQLFQNLTGYGLTAEVARSKRKLRALLRGDGYRGLIVSMIHKFDGADANLSTRGDIFVLIDEAHRSVTGPTLGNYLVAALPNATILGFTGTPIDRTAYGEGTFKIFGRDDAEGYLDKYSIKESIEDGTTLRLNYTLAPSDLRVPTEILEREFLNLKEAEGISDIEELNTILEKAVRTREFLKADNRIAEVAKFVANHFRANVEPLGYKAFLVGVDREACVLYKEALDKLLPQEMSAVVISADPERDDEQVRGYWLSEDDEKKLRRAFVKSESKPFTAGRQTYPSGMPKILIVTQKLLTGFDAPILYCMYLDKPMRDHTLLQAIARVNRPYSEPGQEEKAKPAGLVVDFVGIFDKLEKALAFDPDEVASVIQNIDVLKERFAKLLDVARREYGSIVQPPYDDKSVEQAVEAFQYKATREQFYAQFKEIETLYEIISPDVWLRPFLDNYLALAALDTLVRGIFGSGKPLLNDLMKKTAALVRDHAVLEGLTETLTPVTLDEDSIAALKAKRGSAKAKTINLGRGIISRIKDGPSQPYLIEIRDRTQNILDDLDDRQTETEQALEHLETIVREYQEIAKERERLKLDESTFAFFQTLKQAGLEPVGAQDLATVIDTLFKKYPEQRDNAGQKRALKAELYRELLPKVGKETMVTIADRLMADDQ